MSKKVNIIMKSDGTVGISFEGFQGDDCYNQTDAIKKRLKELGVELEITAIEPTSDNTIPGSKHVIREEQ